MNTVTRRSKFKKVSLRSFACLSSIIVLLLVANSFKSADPPDTDKLLQWNRAAHYDSVLMILSPLYPKWKAKGDHENICNTFKPYSDALLFSGGANVLDTIQYYEDWVYEVTGSKTEQHRISILKVYPLMNDWYIQEAKDLLDEIVQVPQNLSKYPKIYGQAYSYYAYIAILENSTLDALKFNQKSDSIFSSIPDDPNIDLELLSVYNNYGIIYESMGQYAKSLEYSYKALDIIAEHYSKDHPNYAIIINNIGTNYSSIGEFEKSINLLRQAIDLNKKHNRIKFLINNYMNLSGAYLGRHDYDASLQLFKQAQGLLKNLDGDVEYMNFSILRSLSNYYGDLGQHEQAIDYLDQAMELGMNYFGPESYEIGTLYSTKGNLYSNLNDVLTAESSFNKALRIFRYYYEEDQLPIAHLYGFIAMNLAKAGRFEEQLNYIEKSYKVYLARLGPRHAHSLEMKLEEAFCYFNQGKVDLADSLINNFFYIGLSKPLGRNQVIPPYDSLYKSVHLLNALDLKSKILTYKDTGTVEQLMRIVSIHDYISMELDRVLAQYGGFKERDDLRVKSEELFKNAIYTCYQLYDLTGDQKWIDRGYVYSERARGLKLQEIIRDRLAWQAGGIPDSLSQKQLALKSHQKSLNEQLLNLSEEDDPELYSTVEREYYSVVEQYNNLIQYLEKNFPRYYDLKYNVTVVSADQVANEMVLENQSLVQFSLTDTVAYVHIISNDARQFLSIPIQFNLAGEIKLWYDNIKARKFKMVDSIGYGIYNALVKPVLAHVSTSSLIIVPDGVLYYLNFESLPIDEKGKYLIQKYSVQYNYSPTVTYQSNKYLKRPRKKYDWIGFVPGFNPVQEVGIKQQFTHQPWAMATAERVADLFKSKLFKEEHASKQSFTKNASSGKLLHIGTHAVADDDDPLNSFLVFNGEGKGYELIKAFEIFNEDINADCTILSACETAVGKIKGGEGMVSLARAFSYAGCPNLVVTLWPVDDEQTGEIIEGFYRNIADKDNFAMALHNSKLEYLDNAKGELRHPFFWAGIVYYGSTAQLSGTRIPITVSIMTISLLLIAGFLYWYIKKKQVQSKPL